MSHVDVARIDLSRGRKTREPDPAEVMSVIISKNPKASRKVHVAAFNRATNDPLEFYEAFRNRWVSLEYNRLLRAANPPTMAELKQRAAERARKAKDALLRGLWDFVMPNGKSLHECRFSYVAQQGDRFVAIGELGKGRMSARVDSLFNSAAELEAAIRGRSPK